MKEKNWVHIARTKIAVESVLRDLFDIEAPEDAGNWRTYCPLGMEHSDGGASKALRIFSDSNTARCFSHSKTFDPISLWNIHAGSKGVKKPALALLEFYGFDTTPPTCDDRWDKIDCDKEEETPVDIVELKNSVLFFAESELHNYTTIQYRDDVLETVNNILCTADELPETANYGTLQEWASKAKGVLKEYWRSNGWN